MIFIGVDVAIFFVLVFDGGRELILEPREPLGVGAQAADYLQGGDELKTVYATRLGRNYRGESIAELS